MTLSTQAWLLGALCGVLLVAQACEQKLGWEAHMAAGKKAEEQGHYAEAEKHLKAGLREAETFDSQDPRLARSLNNLAAFYYAQERHVDALPLYRRAFARGEKALGPEHPDLARDVNNLAVLY